MIMQIVQLAGSILVYPERHCGTIGFRLSKPEGCAEGRLDDEMGRMGEESELLCAM